MSYGRDGRTLHPALVATRMSLPADLAPITKSDQVLTDPDVTASMSPTGSGRPPSNPGAPARMTASLPEDTFLKKRKYQDNCSSSLRTESNALSLTWAVSRWHD